MRKERGDSYNCRASARLIGQMLWISGRLSASEIEAQMSAIMRRSVAGQGPNHSAKSLSAAPEQDRL